jgi:hypothetical protein
MFRLQFETDTPAFADDPVIETARILRDVAARLERGHEVGGKVRDLNGNAVGAFTLNNRKGDR